MIARSLRLPWLVALLLAACCGQMAMCGPAAKAEEAQTPIRFRRVFAPEDRIKDWPVGDGRYLPIDTAEFERLAAAGKRQESSEPGVPAATIRSTRYEARLVNDDLAGHASFDVMLAGPAPAVLPLEPCNLALDRITWDVANGVSVAEKPASTGVDAGSASNALTLALSQRERGLPQGLGADGRCQAILDRSGRIRFDWSLAGRRDSADVLAFQFEIPNAPANELFLDLPKGLTPSINRGLVVGSEPAGQEMRRWRIELGGQHRFRIRILPDGVAGRRPQLALLRESRTYDFSLRGVEISAQWKLQAHNEPLSQITLMLDPGLQLASARCGDALLPWTVTTLPDQQGTRVVLTLDEPIRDTERVIRLSALGPPTLGRAWRLPRIRPEGLFWQEGGITILIPEPLVADRLVPIGCGQTGTGLLSTPRMGESLQFQAFEPEATVELSLSRRPSVLQLLTATALELSAEEATARMAADFRLIDGARFAIDADVSPHWTVQTVESTPANAVADWTVEPKPDGGQTLAVRLSAGLSPASPLRLVITARRNAAKLRIADLPPIRFRHATDIKRLIAVRPASPCSLNLTGDESLKRLRAENLAPAELELFAELPQDLLFDCDSRADRLEVALVGQKPKYNGAIQIDATVGEGKLCETCVFRCVPRLGRVERVLVQFYPRREAPPRWTLGDDDEQMLVRKWSEDEQSAAGCDASLETWELTLRRPRSAPFEITAVRQTALTSEKTQPADSAATTVLSLASMPEAGSQQGVLSIHAPNAEPLQIDNRRLAPIPPEPLLPDHVQTVRGAFRYDPIRDVPHGEAAAVHVGGRSASPAPSCSVDAWAYRAYLESRYQADGAAQHQATYELENSGRKSLRLDLSPEVARSDVRGLWINGELAEWKFSTNEEASSVSVDLPAGHKTARLVIQWTVAERPLGILGALTPPLPEPDVPVFARSWTAWLPPGYGRFDLAESSPSSGDSASQWRRRLFGPLARAEGADRFDPLLLGDWMMPIVELRAAETPAPTETQGWSVVQMDLDADSTASLRFVYAPSIRMLEAIVFLFAAAVGCWNSARRPVAFIGVLGGFGVAAVSLPIALAPIASGGFLGMLFCLAWRWLRPKTAPSLAEQATVVAVPAAPSPGSTVSHAVQIGLSLIVAMLAISDGLARGEAPPAAEQRATPAAEPPVYRVLVPIDAQKNPTGGKVFLPESLYQQLYRRAEAPAPKQQGWLIARARYHGVLAAESGSGRLGVDALQARYNLHVFGRATRVRIPLRAEGANLLPNGVSLDGRSIDPQWDPDAAALTFDVADPGEYRLEIALRPTVRNNDGPAGFDVVIPRVLRSSLELTLPDGVPAVDVPSACGAVVLEKNPPRLTANLGATDRLTVRWHENAVSGAVGPAIDAEQLLWMRLQPGSVVITAKFKLRVVDGQVQHIQLAADSRLRLLPLQGADPPVVQVGQESGQSRLLAFHWPRPITDQTTLEATFLLSGATGVGNFRLPQIELVDARPVKRWMAVSVDPALDREEQQRQSVEAVSAADFLKAWKEGEKKDAKPVSTSTPPVAKVETPDASLPAPQAAYRLPNGEIDWTISTRPHESRTAVDQTLSLSCDEGRVDMLFEAQVSTTSGYLFQHRLTAPKDWQIESVSLLEGNVERVSRWSREADGAIAVFLNAAASGQQKLTIRGHVPIAMDRAWSLPQVRLERCELRSTTVRLFRRPSVLLTIHGNQQIAGPAPSPNDLANAGLGRFVAAFASDGATPLPITVMVKSNRPIPASLPLGPPADSKATAQSGQAASSGPPKKDAAPESAENHDKAPIVHHRSGVVRLCDIAIAWQADGTFCGVAAFDVDPRGAGHCPLRRPPDCQWINVSVEGMRVQPIAEGDETVRIPLSSQHLPQRIEVVFRGVCDRNAQTRFEAPAVNGWPVQRTLWTVLGPSSWPAGDPEETASVPAWKQDLMRATNAAGAIESAAATSDDLGESPRWYQPWARRLAVARKALLRELASAGPGKDVADARLQLDAIEKRMAKLSLRLSLKEETGVKADDLADGSAMAALRLAENDQPAVLCAFEGPADALTIDCRLAEPAWPAERWWMAFGLVALTALAATAVTRGWHIPWFDRRPYAVVAALGLAWWLWLVPSVLGLAVALVGVLAAGRRRMRM